MLYMKLKIHEKYIGKQLFHCQNPEPKSYRNVLSPIEMSQNMLFVEYNLQTDKRAFVRQLMRTI